MALTDIACRSARPGNSLRKLSDGAGLQLWIKPTGSKLWRFAYRYLGKQKLLALGSYPTLSLADARDGRDKARKLVGQGIDPSAEKRNRVAELKRPGSSFDHFADELIELQKRNCRASATITKLKWLLDLARPKLGHRGVATIKAPELLALLREVELRGRHETARRLRATISCVFRLAIASGKTENDPTYSLRGALASPAGTPHAAVTDPKKFGALLRALDGFDGQLTTRTGLKLLALMFPRPGELRKAEWPEFNFDDDHWLIPANRTKMRRPHKVPLSSQAKTLLLDIQKLTGSGKYVLPSVRSNATPLSENTFNAALRRLGYSQAEATAHGFRASASTLLNESKFWHPDAIERQLAHVEADSARRAYARGEHWDERVRMMQWWSDYLDYLKSSNPTVTAYPRLASDEA